MLPLLALLMYQPIVMSSVTRPPRLLNGAQIATIGDYPAAGLANGWHGINSALVHVLPNGKVESCVITESTAFPGLDKTTCRLIVTRARFAPATDIAGTPIESDYWIANTWGVNDDMPTARIAVPLKVNRIPPDYESPVEVKVVTDQYGKVSSCEMIIVVVVAKRTTPFVII